MVDEDYFKEIDCEEKAYYIGYMAADASVKKDGTKVSFCINTKDRDILERMKEDLKCNNAISNRDVFDGRTKKTYKSTTFQICSTNMVSTLKQYGITNDKTRTFKMPNIDEKFIPALIRGMTDGDGHIGTKEYSLITTKEMISSILKFAASHGVKVERYVERVKPSMNVYKLYVQRDRVKFLDLLYSDSNIHMNRKYNEYLDCKDKWSKEVLYTNKTTPIDIVYKENGAFFEFDTLKDCAEHLGCDTPAIVNILKGRYKRCIYTDNVFLFRHNSVMIKYLRNGDVVKYERK